MATVHPLISFMLSAMAEKPRETMRESIKKFNKGIVAIILRVQAAPVGSTMAAVRAELNTNEESMRGVAHLMCHYMNEDWTVDFQKYSEVRAQVADIAREVTKNEGLATTTGFIIDFYDSMRDVEMRTTDWNAALVSGARDGDLALVSLAQMRGARMYESALDCAERALQLDICARLREWIASSPPGRVASLPPAVVHNVADQDSQ